MLSITRNASSAAGSVLTAALFATFAATAAAQTGAPDPPTAPSGQAGAAAVSTWAPLSDRFQFDAGYFGISANTVLRYNGPQGGSGEVDFEDDLGVKKDATTLWVDATMRLGRRHQFKVSYTKLDREAANFTLGRTFTWGGQTYSAGLDATATTGTDILGAYYRFAVYRNDRFEIGPTVGLGYLWLNAGIRATGTVSGPGGSEGRTLDESATLGSATGAVGAYTNAWLTRRFVVRADYLYIKVSPGESEARVIDWRAGADYYFLSHVGVGVQYKHYTYGYDRAAFDGKLGGDVKYDGVQVFASFLF